MHKIKYIYLVISVFVSFASISQISTNSPYSRFGLGSLSGSVSPQQSALGGASVVYFNSNSINSENPATYSSFQPKSFLLSTALSSSSHRFTTHDKSQRESSTSFSHLAIGFPLTQYISVSSGLLPYSSVGYHLDYDSLYSGLEDTVSISSTGNGGLSKYYLGTSLKLHKTLFFGVNANYLFGGLSKNKTADFNNTTIFNVSSVDRTNVTGLVYEAGLLFNTEISENKYIAIAVTYQNNSNLNAKRTLLGTTYEFGNSLIIKDTFQNVLQDASIIIPSKLSAGFSYSSEKLLLLANYSTQNWSEYQLSVDGIVGEEDNLENSVCFSGGLQYTPDYNAHNKYWKKIQYRIGGRYHKTYLSLRDNQLTEKSLTMGVGMPVKRTNTFYNFSMEFGEQGTTESNLIKEQFLRFTFGVTFKGIWFVKRKYD